VLIKICGITREEDARAAVDAGAGAVGFVFWPKSPRRVDPERARAIAKTLPPFVTPVGVFVNQSVDEVNAVIRCVRLAAVQLHGDEPVGVLDRLEAPVIKAVTTEGMAEAADQWPRNVLLLVDAFDPARRGGTGRTVDWDRARLLAGRRRVLLAGGLTPENVAEAIRRVRPFGIDVSSGVESSPGVKDRALVQALVDAALDAAEGVR
jgi:phosphoribosylanthranilate isomerase